MRIGLSTYDIAASEFTALARAADRAGFASLWLGEHLVLPVAYGSEHPTSGAAVQHHSGPIIDPSTILVDPMVALGAAATTTTQIRLATGIYLVPLRHPVLVARATSTVQELAGGRLMLGVGAGWLAEEFDALGVPFTERGSRLEETLDAVRQLWSGEVVEFEGRHFRFGPVQLGADPVDIPVIMGGNTDRAIRRTVALGDGWFSSGTPSLAEALAIRERIEAESSAKGRTRDLPLWFRTPETTASALSAYEHEGFEEVVIWADRFWPAEGDLDHKAAAFDQAVTDAGLGEFLGR